MSKREHVIRHYRSQSGEGIITEVACDTSRARSRYGTVASERIGRVLSLISYRDILTHLVVINHFQH